MRFIWAVAAFVLAALMIGAGIAQRTIFEGPTTVTRTIEVTGDAPYVLIDGAVLGSHPGSQNLRVEQSGEIFAAYGRTADLDAWLAKADYTLVSAKGAGVESADVPASDPPAADAAPLSPVGSDLWLAEYHEQGTLQATLQLPQDMSLLIATDGTAAAPKELTVTWPVHNSTPWAGPLIVGGCLLLVAGLLLYYLGVRHARRSRGPRRKGLPLPATEPIDLSVEGADKGVITAAPTRRQLSSRRRSLIAVPAFALTAALFTGCSADAWPDIDGGPTPSESPTVIVPEDQGSPVVTKSQAESIVARAAAAVADADTKLDAAAAATRLDGSALAVRETNYRLRAALPDQAAPAAIPSGALDVVLPEANDQWPRTFLAVAAGEGTDPDLVMSVTQQDPWSAYKITRLAQLTSDTTLQLAPEYVGAIPILPDSPFLTIAPDELGAAYADVLTNGEQSQFAALFDMQDDAFITSTTQNRAERLAKFNATGVQTGAMAFSSEADASPPVALATLDSGAIVAVTVLDRDTVTPTTPDAVIKLDGDPPNPVVATLTGVTQSSTGFTTTYADQLFFFVPSQSSKERIRLLGFSSNILDAKVVG